jgi:WD40 repeat protein
VLTGFSGGLLAMFSRQGELLWQGSVGEFPMVLEMDANYNSYLAGKNRELFSFDGDGNLRWRYRIATHVVTAGANNMDAAGDKIAMGTVSGWVLVFNSAGEFLWQRRLGGELQGHNALDMTPDGRFIVVGSAGEMENDGYISLFGGDGGLLWRVQYPDGRDLGTVSAPYEYDHNHRGAITVAISDDGRYIAAGFGDSTIRIFEYAP